MTGQMHTFPLIRTKLQRPRLPGDLVPWRRLLDRLHAGSNRKLILISAQAGTGKSTLLAQWPDECPRSSTRLSLGERDKDLTVLLAHPIGVVRTVFPTQHLREASASSQEE